MTVLQPLVVSVAVHGVAGLHRGLTEQLHYVFINLILTVSPENVNEGMYTDLEFGDSI